MVELSCEGDLRYAKNFFKAYGGDAINTAVAARRLGSSVGFITRVGADPFAFATEDTSTLRRAMRKRLPAQPVDERRCEAQSRPPEGVDVNAFGRNPPKSARNRREVVTDTSRPHR